MKRILTLIRRRGRSAGDWLVGTASALALVPLLIGLAGALGWWGESPPYPALASRIEDATGGVLSYWSAMGLAGALGMLARLAWKWSRGRPSLDGAEILWGVIGGAGGVLLILLANFTEGRAERATIRTRGYGIGVLQLADGRIQVALERARVQYEGEWLLRASVASLYDALDAYVEAHHLMADTTGMPFPPPPVPALRLARLFDAEDELSRADSALRWGSFRSDTRRTAARSACFASLHEALRASRNFLNLLWFDRHLAGERGYYLSSRYLWYSQSSDDSPLAARLAEFNEEAREAREQTADALLTCTRATAEDERERPRAPVARPRGYGIGVVQLADGRIRVALEKARAQNEYTLSAHIARLYDALDAYVEAHHLMVDTTWMPFPPPPLPALRLARLFDAGDEFTGAWEALFQYGLVSPGTDGQSGCLDSLLEVTYATLPMLPLTDPILYRFHTYYDFELARPAEFDEDAREAQGLIADALLTCTRATAEGA